MNYFERLRPGQYQLQHLLGLTTALAVLLAVLVPLLRGLDWRLQASVAIQATILGAVLFGVLVLCSWRRYRVEMTAGRLFDRFTRKSSHWLSWLMISAMAAWYLLCVLLRTGEAANQGEIAVFPGSPQILLIGAHYLIVRCWWKIDPMGLEAFEAGLCLGGFQLIRWEQINRWSWSGRPPRQLNLFLVDRTVRNIPTDIAFQGRLEEILQEHGPPTSLDRPS
jgi:MFS family permease